MTRIRAWVLISMLSLFAFPCFAAVETPYLAEKVASGALPPVDQRLPAEPSLVTFDDDNGEPGPGKWVTIYANDGHVFMYVAGVRFDTSGRGSSGSRWQTSGRDTGAYTAVHPPGL